MRNIEADDRSAASYRLSLNTLGMGFTGRRGKRKMRA